MLEHLHELKDEVRYVRGAFGHYMAFDLNTMFHLASMPRTTIDMAAAFLKRGPITNHPDRRHPEYRFRMTMMCLSHYWELSTGLNILDNPLAAEATSIFVSYIYALDDYLDEGPATTKLTSLDDIERGMNVNGYSGKDMDWHFINSVRRGTRDRDSSQIIAARVHKFTSDFYEIYRRVFFDEKLPNYTIAEAMQYRDSTSAEMGRVIADIMNFMSGTTPDKAKRARQNLGMVAMIGQLHDEWWDLVPEIRSGKNILSLTLQQHPEEFKAVESIIQTEKLALVPFIRLQEVAPEATHDYYALYLQVISTGNHPKIQEDMIAMYHHLLPITRNVPQKWVSSGVTQRKHVT